MSATQAGWKEQLTELRDEIPFPDPGSTLRDLRRYDCRECLGKGYTYEVEKGNDEQLIQTSCRGCHGTGLVCPECRGDRVLVKERGADLLMTRNSDSRPQLMDCPGCHYDKSFSMLRMIETLRAAWREEAPF